MIKKIFIISILLIFILFNYTFTQANNKKKSKGKKTKKGFPCYLYKDAFYRWNHYYPSGWMGDFEDIQITENYTNNPITGKSCFRIRYTAEKNQDKGWAGIYWQNPANNWGTVRGGYNLTSAKKLYFFSRGEKGGELAEFKIGGIRGKFTDSTAATTGPIELTKNWKLYEIDLTDMNLSFIIGGFCIVFSVNMNPKGAVFYLDEIYYTDKNKPIPLEKIKKQKKEQFIKSSTNNSKIKIGLFNFKNLTKNVSLDYLSNTLPESINTILARNTNIIIIETEKIREQINFTNFKESTYNYLQLNKKIGIQHLITGSFIEIKGKIYVNLKVIDIISNKIIYGKNIQGESGKNIFFLIDKISKDLDEFYK